MSESTTEQQSAETAGQQAQQTEQGNPDEAALGDAGKKALDAMKAERNAAQKREKALQAQLDQINQANETAVEKANREATEAREAAAKATADALRFRVAAKNGISDDDAELFLTGTDEETLERQAARLVERTPATSAAGPRPDLSQGSKGGSTGSGSPEQDFATFLGSHLSR